MQSEHKKKNRERMILTISAKLSKRKKLPKIDI